MLIGEGLKLNLNSIQKIDLSHNPLGHLGVMFILNSKSECPSIKHYGVQETSAAKLQKVHPIIGIPDYHGYFSLNLSNPFEYTIADLLNIRRQRRGGIWRDTRLNGKAFDMKNFGREQEGTLSYFYVDSDTLAPEYWKPPSVHFRFNIKKKDDRNMLNGLIERSYREIGSNIRNLFVDGKRFDMENYAKDFTSVEKDFNGNTIVELEYTSSTLCHQDRYSMDLSVSKDRALVHKLLERIFETTQAAQHAKKKAMESKEELFKVMSYPDRWENALYNGSKFDLAKWSINFEMIEASLGNKDGTRGHHMKKTSEKNSWRVPEHGVLEFDHQSAHPVSLEVESLKFDMSVLNERTQVVNRWLRASKLPGQTIFNCFLDGKPFHFDESLWRERKMLKALPLHGTMVFDYVTASPKETSRNMQRSSLQYDLSVHAEREEALMLLHRQQQQGEHIEFWMNIKIDKEDIANARVLQEDCIVPEKGKLSFEVIYFPKNNPVRDEIFVVILEQLEQQMSPKEALEQLRYACTAACEEEKQQRYFTCKMVSSILSIFHDIKDQWKVLQLLLPITVDPHCCKFIRRMVLDHRTRIELDRWLRLETSLLLSKSPYPVKASDRNPHIKQTPREVTSMTAGAKVDNNAEKVVKDKTMDDTDDNIDATTSESLRSKKKRKSII